MWFDLSILIAGILSLIALRVLVVRILRRERELRRFSPSRSQWWIFLGDDVRKFIQYRVAQRRRRREQGSDKEVIRLAQAGLESVESREKYYLAKDFCIVVTIVVCVSSFALYPESLAVIITIATIALGYYGPLWWLKQRAIERQKRYERELPFFLQSVACGTGVGWDSVKVLNNLADTFDEFQSVHPLIHELRRAQWYATTGGSWSDGFRGLSERFPNPMISHTISALGGALEADVGKHELLEGIAKDAHRNYLVRLEGRLAVLPVASIIIGFLLIVGFALLLQVPFL